MTKEPEKKSTAALDLPSIAMAIRILEHDESAYDFGPVLRASVATLIEGVPALIAEVQRLRSIEDARRDAFAEDEYTSNGGLRRNR